VAKEFRRNCVKDRAVAERFSHALRSTSADGARRLGGIEAAAPEVELEQRAKSNPAWTTGRRAYGSRQVKLNPASTSEVNLPFFDATVQFSGLFEREDFEGFRRIAINTPSP
jgi:hypothetical protein